MISNPINPHTQVYSEFAENTLTAKWRQVAPNGANLTSAPKMEVIYVISNPINPHTQVYSEFGENTLGANRRQIGAIWHQRQKWRSYS